MTAAGDAGASAVFGIPDVLGPAPGPGSASALRLEATQALTADRDRLAADLAAARAEVAKARNDALEEAAREAEKAGQAMTEKGPWDEGMRDIAVRIAIRLRALAALVARTRGDSDAG